MSSQLILLQKFNWLNNCLRSAFLLRGFFSWSNPSTPLSKNIYINVILDIWCHQLTFTVIDWHSLSSDVMRCQLMTFVEHFFPSRYSEYTSLLFVFSFSGHFIFWIAFEAVCTMSMVVYRYKQIKYIIQTPRNKAQLITRIKYGCLFLGNKL